MNDLSDEELMLNLTRGSQKAFSVLYFRHKGRLMTYLITKTKSLTKAEDLFQIVFEKLYTKSHLFKNTYKFLPWFFTIAHNTFLDSKQKKTETLGALKEQIDKRNHIYAHTPKIDLSSLSLKQKTAMELKYWQDHDYTTIAKKMHTSEQNVRKLISRALLKIKTNLKQENK